MIYEFDSLEAYVEACQRDAGLKGLSPGGASAKLGIGRQGVYTACRRGSLDLVRIAHSGRTPVLYVTDASIERYFLNSKGKVGGPRVRLLDRVALAVDKHVHGVWPNP